MPRDPAKELLLAENTNQFSPLIPAQRPFDVPDSSSRVPYVISESRDHVYVSMVDGLPGSAAAIRANVVTVWPELRVQHLPRLL